MLRPFTNPGASKSVQRKQRTIVSLHGLLGDVSNWDSLVAYFQGQYRVLPIDFRLYRSDSPYHNVASLTRYVLKEMDTLDVDNAVLFGNSMGGQVALDVTLAAPERVVGLVLTGSSGLLERGYMNETPLNPTREYVRERVKEVFYDPVHATDDLVEMVYSILQSTRNKLRLVKLARSLRAQSMHDYLPKISVPTLLVWGREDTITPLCVAETFAERLPNAKMAVLDNCGHAPNLERAEEFNRLAEEFLCQIGFM